MQKTFKKKRGSGVLLHITSLPGKYGIGEIGEEAKIFIDNLIQMNQSYWQILPTNFPETCDSPYDTNSAFAQNPYLISLDSLINDKLISSADLEPIPKFKKDIIDFKKLKDWKNPILKKAAYNFSIQNNKDEKQSYKKFCIENDFWLNDYSFFMVIKGFQKKKSWQEWDHLYKDLDKKSLEQIGIKFKGNIEEIKILQYLFNKQWKLLKSYANDKGLEIIGDIPIYISFNSADVWKNQSLFKLDDNHKMKYQSGCPPDHFMEDGQLWGHPIYNWDAHMKTGFEWWINRIKFLTDHVDIVRVDHFNGFAKYWEVPAKHSTAVNGKWEKAKGMGLLREVYKSNNKVFLIAEDLGEATLDAAVIRKEYNIPGMEVLQYALYDEHPLKNMQENTVLYTGTHDNDTSLGWYKTISKGTNQNEMKHVENILDLDTKAVNWSMIEYSLESKAFIVMVPIQDLLGLFSEGRMNTPGTISNQNWSWRMESNDLQASIKEKMKKITKKANRV